MKCAHEHCTCFVAESPGFCSDLCRRAVDDAEIGTPDENEEGGMVMDCGCGHPECEGSPATVR
jgi:hypothetical protein